MYTWIYILQLSTLPESSQGLLPIQIIPLIIHQSPTIVFHAKYGLFNGLDLLGATFVSRDLFDQAQIVS